MDLVFQGMIEQPADPSYKNKEVLDFELILGNNFYTNLKSLHIGFPIYFEKLSNATANVNADIDPINNFFAHWVKEINTLKYGPNKSLIPTSTPQKFYQCSDSILKLLPKTLQK